MLDPLKRFHSQAYSSITDFNFYKDVFTQPLSKTLLYLVLLSVHVAAALTLIFAWQTGSQFLEVCNWAQQNFPVLTVQNGKLSINNKQPLIKKYYGEQSISFIFDTTGTYSDPREIQEPAFLFTQEKLYLHVSGQTRTYYWKDLGTFQISPETFQEIRSFLKWVYIPIFYPMLLGYTLLSKTLLAIVLSVIALSASTRYNVRLPFRQYFTLSLYSLTPAVVIDLAVAITGVQILYFDFFYIATAALYTYLATQKCVMEE